MDNKIISVRVLQTEHLTKINEQKYNSLSPLPPHLQYDHNQHSKVNKHQYIKMKV